jgi:hypothetical protein
VLRIPPERRGQQRLAHQDQVEVRAECRHHPVAAEEIDERLSIE